MELIVGVGASSASAILFCWAFAQHRRPIPAAWTQRQGLSSLFCVALTLLSCGGAGATLIAALNPIDTWNSLNILGAAISAALLAGAFILAPRYVAIGRQIALPVAVNIDAPPSILEEPLKVA
jgi:hypothetical protein